MRPFFLLLICAFALALSPTGASAQIPLDDSERHYVLIIEPTAGNTPGQIDQMFRSDHRLQVLRSRVHYLAINPNSREHGLMYAERYEKSVPRNTLPAVMLLRSDGGVIYKASRGQIPQDANQLYDEILAAAVKAQEPLPVAQQHDAHDHGHGRPGRLLDRVRPIRDTPILSPRRLVGPQLRTYVAVGLGLAIAFFILSSSNTTKGSH